MKIPDIESKINLAILNERTANMRDELRKLSGLREVFVLVASIATLLGISAAGVIAYGVVWIRDLDLRLDSAKQGVWQESFPVSPDGRGIPVARLAKDSLVEFEGYAVENECYQPFRVLAMAPGVDTVPPKITQNLLPELHAATNNLHWDISATGGVSVKIDKTDNNPPGVNIVCFLPRIIRGSVTK